MGKYSDAKKAANKRWDGKNLFRVSVAFPADYKERIQAAAENAGESKNAYIIGAVRERMQKESDKGPGP